MKIDGSVAAGEKNQVGGQKYRSAAKKEAEAHVWPASSSASAVSAALLTPSGMSRGRELLHHDRQLCAHYACSIIYREEIASVFSPICEGGQKRARGETS
ncbi:hypothetical protein Zmor_009136 [Zophobas morio]|uniref:Uncharacterized protein n=1 Tax=Zophobas morio TaxID=2755281 RepID=A0AA38IJY0_9CUCU|nr:hypothetical protein Zmor_009136 [Zophobas morio]